MRISDWSSDVCSSDLLKLAACLVTRLLADKTFLAQLHRAPVLTVGQAKVGLSLLQLRLGDAVVQLHQHLSLGDLAALVEINGRNAPGDFRAQYDGVFRPQTADRKSTRLNSSH